MKGLGLVLLGIALGAALAAWTIWSNLPVVPIHQEVIHSPAPDHEDGQVIEPQLTMPDEPLQATAI